MKRSVRLKHTPAEFCGSMNCPPEAMQLRVFTGSTEDNTWSSLPEEEERMEQSTAIQSLRSQSRRMVKEQLQVKRISGSIFSTVRHWMDGSTSVVRIGTPLKMEPLWEGPMPAVLIH